MACIFCIILHFVHYYNYIAQQTGQHPKVKSPPPVPPKPKRDQSQPAATPQPKQLDLSSEQSQDKTKTKSLLAGIILLLISN